MIDENQEEWNEEQSPGEAIDEKPAEEVAESAGWDETESIPEKADVSEAHGTSEDTGYTGEYGNQVQGTYREPEKTTYRYSYQNGSDETAHSGDYYAAGKEPESDSEWQEKKEDRAFPSDEQEENRKASEDFLQRGVIFQGIDEKEIMHFSTTSGGNFNRPKRKGSFAKKLLVTAVCAVVFGLIAGASFHAVSYIYHKNNPELATGGEVLEKTTDNKAAGEQNKTTGNSSSSISGTTDVSSIAEQTMPAIVAITSTTKGMDYIDLFGQYYPGQDTTSAGTGFIVGQNEKELLIATNNHVIEGAKTISVQFIDGEIYEATQKGTDSANDLAVVAVKATDVKKTTMDKIRVADLGDSDKAKVGEMVVAIGNALGYGQSVTVGYISAKDREITESSDNSRSAGNKIKALQTDAAINPGNSGGALINMQGQVIGINSAKIASSSVEGVGYAIPISVATPIIDDLMNREELKDSEKGYLGITGNTVSEEATAYNVPNGVYVRAVAKGGAADKAGIKENDIITAINNMQVTTMESLKEKVNSYKVGTEISVTFQRSSDGEYKEQTVKVTLQGEDSTKDLPTSAPNQNSNGNNGNSNGNNDGYGDNGDNEGNDSYGNGGYDDFWDFFR